MAYDPSEAMRSWEPIPVEDSQVCGHEQLQQPACPHELGGAQHLPAPSGEAPRDEQEALLPEPHGASSNHRDEVSEVESKPDIIPRQQLQESQTPSDMEVPLGNAEDAPALPEQATPSEVPPLLVEAQAAGDCEAPVLSGQPEDAHDMEVPALPKQSALVKDYMEVPQNVADAMPVSSKDMPCIVAPLPEAQNLEDTHDPQPKAQNQAAKVPALSRGTPLHTFQPCRAVQICTRSRPGLACGSVSRMCGIHLASLEELFPQEPFNLIMACVYFLLSVEFRQEILSKEQVGSRCHYKKTLQ